MRENPAIFATLTTSLVTSNRQTNRHRICPSSVTRRTGKSTYLINNPSRFTCFISVGHRHRGAPRLPVLPRKFHLLRDETLIYRRDIKKREEPTSPPSTGWLGTSLPTQQTPRDDSEALWKTRGKSRYAAQAVSRYWFSVSAHLPLITPDNKRHAIINIGHDQHVSRNSTDPLSYTF